MCANAAVVSLHPFLWRIVLAAHVDCGFSSSISRLFDVGLLPPPSVFGYLIWGSSGVSPLCDRGQLWSLHEERLWNYSVILLEIEDVSFSLFGHTTSKGSGSQFPTGAKKIGDSEATGIVHFSQVAVVSWRFDVQGLGFCASTEVGATCSFLHLLPPSLLGCILGCLLLHEVYS